MNIYHRLSLEPAIEDNDEIKEKDIKPMDQFISSSLSGTSNSSRMMKSKKKIYNQSISVLIFSGGNNKIPTMRAKEKIEKQRINLDHHISLEQQQESNEEVKEKEIKPNNEFRTSTFSGTNNKFH
jgi:hypothetical protein